MSPIAATPPPPALHATAHHAAALPAATATKDYRVRWGDTVSAIALRHRTTVGALVTLNRLSDGGSRIYVGQTLKIPAPGTTVTPRRPAPAPSRTTTGTTFTVTTAFLNVRTGPSTSHPRVGQLRQGQQVRGTLDRRTGWVRLSDGRWAIGVHLRAGTSAPAPAPAPKPTRPAPTTMPNPGRQTVAQNKAWLRSHPAPSRDQLRSMITSTARRYGVSPRLALAISMVESSQDHRQVSYCNAIGAMQVMPTTGTWVSSLLGRNLNLLNAQDNVTAGVYLLKVLVSQARSEDEAIAGYYQGLWGVQHHGMYPDTKQYVAKVRYWKTRV